MKVHCTRCMPGLVQRACCVCVSVVHDRSLTVHESALYSLYAWFSSACVLCMCFCGARSVTDSA